MCFAMATIPIEQTGAASIGGTGAEGWSKARFVLARGRGPVARTGTRNPSLRPWPKGYERGASLSRGTAAHPGFACGNSRNHLGTNTRRCGLARNE